MKETSVRGKVLQFVDQADFRGSSEVCQQRCEKLRMQLPTFSQITAPLILSQLLNSSLPDVVKLPTSVTYDFAKHMWIEPDTGIEAVNLTWRQIRDEPPYYPLLLDVLLFRNFTELPYFTMYSNDRYFLTESSIRITCIST